VFITVCPSMHKPFVTFRMEQDDVAFPINYEITSNNPIFNRDVVLEGFGISLLPITVVEQDIKVRRLVRLLEEHEIADTAVRRFDWPTGRTLMPAKVRAFIDHAAEFFEGGAETSAAARWRPRSGAMS